MDRNDWYWLLRITVEKQDSFWYHFRHFLWCSLGGIITLLLYLYNLWQTGGKAGLLIFTWMGIFSLAGIILVSPYFAAYFLLQEKERGTFELLLLTDYPYWKWFLLKVGYAVGEILMGIACLIPYFFLCGTLGGVDVTQLLHFIPLFLATMIMGIGSGLLVVAFTHKRASLYQGILWILFAWLVLLPIFIFCLQFIWNQDPKVTEGWMKVVSPFAAFRYLLMGENMEQIYKTCSFMVGGGILSGIIGAWILPVWYLSERPWIHRVLKWIQKIQNRTIRRRHQVPPCEGNPVLWKELWIHAWSGRSNWLQILWQLSLILGCLFLIQRAFSMIIEPQVKVSWEIQFYRVSGAFLAITGVIYFYRMIIMGSSTCIRELENGTWELLLMTDLSGYSIIMGKIHGITLALLPWILTLTITGVCFAYLCAWKTLSIYGFFLVLIPFNLFCMVYGYNFFLMYWGLRSKNFSTIHALVGFVGWYVIGNIFLVTLGIALALPTFFLSLIVIPLGGPLLLGEYFRQRLIQRFPQFIINLLDHH